MSVTKLRQRLTPQDIERLILGDSAEERATATHKVCRRIDQDDMSEDQRQIAGQILTILAGDAAALVRRTLAVTLRNSPSLPRETALRLARDIEGVATPVLKNSPALTDADLIELIEAGSPEKQLAIAERGSISAPVTEAIAEHGDIRTVKTMTGNEGAAISETAFDTSLQRFGTDPDMHRSVIARERIPIGIAEKLVTMVSGELFDTLVNRHELPPKLAIEIAENTRERATLDLIEQAGCSADPANFARQLNLNHRLTHTLIMRAMCMGHVHFVECALSELSSLPHKRIWLLLHDSGPRGLKTLFRCTSLPPRMLRVFELAIEASHEIEIDSSALGRERFRRRMIERVLTRCPAMPQEDMNYLLDKLDALDEIETSNFGFERAS